jgi:signal peptidase II
MREIRLPHLALWILALDQGTKWWVEHRLPVEVCRPLYGGVLALNHIHNAGVAWGLLENTGRLVLVASLAAMAWLILFWATLPKHGRSPISFALGLSCFLGGSAGNTLDRLRLGHVTDFLQLPNGLVINLADVAITLGVLLVCHALWCGRPVRTQAALTENLSCCAQ